jgi:hypothetical protein
MLGAQERAFEVDVHRELPLLDRTLLQGLTCGGAHNVAGVVDQDVDLAEFSEDRVDGGCHLLLEADVANEPCGPSTGIRGNPARCALRVGQDAAGDGDIGAGFGERGRHVKTQVAGPPCHQGGFAREIEELLDGRVGHRCLRSGKKSRKALDKRPVI